MTGNPVCMEFMLLFIVFIKSYLLLNNFYFLLYQFSFSFYLCFSHFVTGCYIFVIFHFLNDSI